MTNNDKGDNSLVFQAETLLPTLHGSFRCRVYLNADGVETIAIATRGLEHQRDVPVRVHSACFTSEVLGSLKCDCNQQLEFAMRYIAEHGGVVLYLPQEGRGIGLSNKIRAYALQEDGHDTIAANHLLGLPVDARSYEDAANMLRDLGVRRLRLITNNPEKIEALSSLGLTVSGRIPVPAQANSHSASYLETKRARMGHWLDVSPGDGRRAGDVVTGRPKRPYVHVNFAIDDRGRSNQDNGQAAELSCEMDWRRVHELRERYSAVVVGANTWLRDKPRLTAREEHLGRPPERQPARVVFSGRSPCHVEPDARRSFIIGDPANKVVDCVHIGTADRDLRGPLEELYHHKLESLLVEGGLTLLRSFISQEMVDRVTIYVCTESVDAAVRAVSDLFPELPVSSMQVCTLGKGILLSHAPGTGASHDWVQAEPGLASQAEG